MEPALIDTDIISYFLKGNEKVFIKFQNYLKHFDSLNFSIISYYEIMSGLTFINATKQLTIFENFCSTASILDITKDSVTKSAEIYSTQGLIAGIALSNNLILVTNNLKHFGKIEELKIENLNE